MRGHSTHWEDDGMAGVYCDGKDADVIAVDSTNWHCCICGKHLRLIWDVRLEEISESDKI